MSADNQAEKRPSRKDAVVRQRMDIWDSGYRAGRADTEEAVLDAMTPPTGGPDDAFWRGAQWAYRQVRDRLERERAEQVHRG